MANRIETNKIYKCAAASVGSASIHVAGGTVQIKGSNSTHLVTERGTWSSSIAYAMDDIVSYKNNLFLVKKNITGVEPNIGTEEDENYKKIQANEIKNGMLVPRLNELLDTGDNLKEGIHIVAGLPEWFAFIGNANEIWIKAGINDRIVSGDE